MKTVTYEHFMIAMGKATETFGQDPAYYGEEGRQELDKELIKLGYTKEDLEYTEKLNRT